MFTITVPLRAEIWPIDGLRPNPLNPRVEIQPSGLGELASSIAEQGILQPLLITPDGDVVAGHRRLAAARIAGLHEIPVLVHDLDSQRQQEIMLVENLQRQDLSVVEEARAYRRLIDAGSTTADVARHVGVNAARVKARLVLLELDEQVQWMFHRGDLPITLAAVLLRVPDSVRQRQIATMAVRRRLTVPELERIVERGAGALNAPPPRSNLSPDAPARQGLSPSRLVALTELEQHAAQLVSVKLVANLFRNVCCACGMEDLPAYCSGCPMLDLINQVLTSLDRTPHKE